MAGVRYKRLPNRREARVGESVNIMSSYTTQGYCRKCEKEVVLDCLDKWFLIVWIWVGITNITAPVAALTKAK